MSANEKVHILGFRASFPVTVVGDAGTAELEIDLLRNNGLLDKSDL